MGRAMTICLALALTASACRNDVLVVGGVPAPPRSLTVTYYASAVTVSWELDENWNGEAFRIYARNVADPSYAFIAEVTSCDSQGFCTYTDVNVLQDQTYEYYVSAVGSGSETSTAVASVYVPTYTPPPVPDAPYVIALDGANYLTWGTASRGAADFSYYTVYLDDGGSVFLLGETDSEGFLDLLAANGTTSSYYVTAVDTDGHESDGSVLASGTPRPDYHGEWIYAYEAQPASSGFRFQADEGTVAIVDGNGGTWDLRLESDGSQWWLRTGTGVSVYDNGGYVTSALKCGVGADFTCTDVSVAPTNPASYVTGLYEMIAQTTYVIRVNDTDGTHYGAIRVEFLGFDTSDPIMIFDWAFQLQVNNPELVSGG